MDLTEFLTTIGLGTATGSGGAWGILKLINKNQDKNIQENKDSIQKLEDRYNELDKKVEGMSDNSREISKLREEINQVKIELERNTAYDKSARNETHKKMDEILVMVKKQGDDMSNFLKEYGFVLEKMRNQELSK